MFRLHTVLEGLNRYNVKKNCLEQVFFHFLGSFGVIRYNRRKQEKNRPTFTFPFFAVG